MLSLLQRFLSLLSRPTEPEPAMPESTEPAYISPDCVTIIKHFEGCRLSAYRDPVGIWTIGYGQTEGVHAGMTITQGQADSMLQKALADKYVPGVQRMFGPLEQHRADALVSFAYNLGVGALQKSTLRKKILAGDWAGAADEFLKWHYAGGRSLLGLRKRRAAERARFLGHTAREAIKIGEASK